MVLQVSLNTCEDSPIPLIKISLTRNGENVTSKLGYGEILHWRHFKYGLNMI